ncbi:hypothetical protein [Archaeoglobus sp.]
MEVIKAFSISVETPKDLVEEYFKLRKVVLDEIFRCIKYSKSGKAHLKFNKAKRKD